MGLPKARWDQVGPNGTQWDQVGPSGPQWEQVGPSGTQWDQVGPGGAQWDQDSVGLPTPRPSPRPSAHPCALPQVKQARPLKKWMDFQRLHYESDQEYNQNFLRRPTVVPWTLTMTRATRPGFCQHLNFNGSSWRGPFNSLLPPHHDLKLT